MAEGWNDISIKDKMQIINGTLCVIGAIALYFIGFLVMLIGNMPLVSAGATLLAAGLAFFGIASYFKHKMSDFESEVGRRMNRLEEIERKIDEQHLDELKE